MTVRPYRRAASASDRARTRAAGRCECTGQCGAGHVDDGGRCPRLDGPRAASRLFVAAADLTVTPAQAVRLVPEYLLVWCPKCHTAAHRRAHPKTIRVPAGQDALFT